MRRRRRRGQAAIEYALVTVGVVLPVTFALIYTALQLWVWHTVNDFTRRGARYAATHCWQNGAGNVIQWMQQNFPLTWDRQQFLAGAAQIKVSYYTRNPETGAYEDFSCAAGECSLACVPDAVRVQILNYEFRGLSTYFGLPPLPIPDFQTTLPVESAGCDPGASTCRP